MAQNLKSGDKVTIIAGSNKGKSGKIIMEKYYLN